MLAYNCYHVFVDCIQTNSCLTSESATLLSCCHKCDEYSVHSATGPVSGGENITTRTDAIAAYSTDAYCCFHEMAVLKCSTVFQYHVDIYMTILAQLSRPN